MTIHPVTAAVKSPVMSVIAIDVVWSFNFCVLYLHSNLLCTYVQGSMYLCMMADVHLLYWLYSFIFVV